MVRLIVFALTMYTFAKTCLHLKRFIRGFLASLSVFEAIKNKNKFIVLKTTILETPCNQRKFFNHLYVFVYVINGEN